jgi:hypothetical protein
MPKSVRPVKSLSKSAPKLSVTKKRKSLSSKIVKKKPYIELITALLSIPVLITLFLLNLNTLKNINNPTPTPTPQKEQVFKNGNQFFAAPVPETSVIPSTAPLTLCTKALGPVAITSPDENDTVTDNPVVINIEYDDNAYCGAAWSYRINGGSWSGYDDRSVALYNLPRGSVTFDLRVKSIVTSEEKSLTRKFIYNGNGTVLVPDPNSSGSAN